MRFKSDPRGLSLGDCQNTQIVSHCESQQNESAALRA